MSGRRAGGNRIRGPQSALTDFLASNNISSAQIQADYARRQREAQQQQDAEAARNGAGHIDEGEAGDERAETTIQKKKRRRDQEKALAKIKGEKSAKKRKKSTGENVESGVDDDDISFDMYAKKKPLPGQLENCELCGKRFTVTPYSKTGPDGDLLCVKCSKEQDSERKKDEKAQKKINGREKRRQKQSDLLDGIVQIGAKSLQELCIKEVANHIHEVDEFGDLPQALLGPLSQILSRNRLITSRTKDLFLRPDLDRVDLYECGNLETDDYIRLFSVIPTLRTVNLRNAGQFKDEVLDYMMERDVPVEHLQLEAANLVSNGKWMEYFSRCGHRLVSLKLAWLDNAMDETAFVHVLRNSPNLRQVKIRKCFKLGEKALLALSRLEHLEQLSLQDIRPTTSIALARLISAVGEKLKTLSLEDFVEADDVILAAIRSSCPKLNKLRLTGNDICTDAGFRDLFIGSTNIPLSVVDFHKTRSMDYSQPDGPEKPVGLASDGFEALMEHSSSAIERLNVTSCRHITYESFSKVFDGRKQYPLLKEIAINFLTKIDTTIVAGMFKSCPQMVKVEAFGCFNVTCVAVPKGVALIGLPNAQSSIVQEGDVDADL